MNPYITPAQAVALLQQSKVVALPTETVYGLGADATRDAAVAAIYATKSRPAFNPLIIHVATMAQAALYVQMDRRAQQLATAFWPGPLTLVLPLLPQSTISLLACAGLRTLGVRVPAHPQMLEVLRAFDKPVAAPSANPSLGVSPTTAAHVAHAFAGTVPILDGGPCLQGLESTILDLSGETPTLLRPGPLTLDQIQAVIGPVAVGGSDGDMKAPGQMRRHYAPTKPVRLNAHAVTPREGLIAFGPDVPQGAHVTMNLSDQGDLQEAAARLFGVLHDLDTYPITGIAVVPIPMQGLGVAINDRLTRAAAPLESSTEE